MPPATQIRVGHFVKLNNDLFNVLKIQHVTPGKGNAVMQTEMRNVKTGIKINQRFRSTENVDIVTVFDRNMNYLYQDGDTYHFMDPETYDQVEVYASVMQDVIPYLQAEQKYQISSFEEEVIAVQPPMRMTFEVKETDAPSKNKTGSAKYAILENDVQVKVPQFIVTGDKVVIDTRENTYCEKV